MTSRRWAVGPIRRGAHLRRTLAWIAAAGFVASPLHGRVERSALGTICPPAHAAPPAPQDAPRPVDPDSILRAASSLALAGALDPAAAVLSDALIRWPDHAALLEGLAAVRIRQGRLDEAGALAVRLTRVDPGSGAGWELLAASRYLQDDRSGALRAWARHRSPVVRDVEVRVLAHDGPRIGDAGTDPTRLTGIPAGRSLTVDELVRAERRLAAIPAGSTARLGYRALADGDVALEGTVVLGSDNPFTRPALVAHGLRMLVGRVRIVSSDPIGRLERWELSGGLEGSLRTATVSLEHPAPLASGVWRWTVDHAQGRYASTAEGAPVRSGGTMLEQRSGVEWRHEDWVTASLLGAARLSLDVRPGRGTFAGAGADWTLVSLSARGSVGVEGTAWTRVGGADDGVLDPASRFGRLALRASLRPSDAHGPGPPSGLYLRGGVVAVSAGAPADLRPRIGAGGSTTLLMRAYSDLDDEGVVRPLFPGRAWAHGGVEVLRGLGSVGPLGVGVALFADAVRVLGPARASPDSGSPARRGAIHLGAGARVRVPVVAGWLRADWAVDPSDGSSRVSAAWVSGAPS